MTNSEKPQPMEVDQKKPEEKTEEKQELVSLFFCRVIICYNAIFPRKILYLVIFK